MFFRRLLPLLCALSAACVTSVPEDGRPCPCSAGWTCCGGQCAQVAACPAKVGASTGGSASTSSGSSGGSGGSSSGGGGSLSGPAAFPVDYVFAAVSSETATGTEVGGIATVEEIISSADLSSWAASAEATGCIGGRAAWEVSARAIVIYLSEASVPLATGTAYAGGEIYLGDLLPDGGSETIARAYPTASGPIGSSGVTFSILSDLEVAGTFSADLVQLDGSTTTIAGSFDSAPFVAPVCPLEPPDGGCGNVTCPTGCDLNADCTECIPQSSTAGAGSSCVTTNDCCTGSCVGGVCTPPGSGSSSSGGTTTTGSSGGGSSSSASASCFPLQAACVLDQDCCNTASATNWTLCYANVCCIAAYAQCGSSADCCSGSCTAGSCEQCDGGICGA